MKELGEIYWEIHHKWYEESLSLAEQMTLLHKAAEEYVENLLKYGERWKSILKYDLDLLEVSSQCRKEVEGYSDGAKIFRNYIFGKLKRYGLNNDDIRIPKYSEAIISEIKEVEKWTDDDHFIPDPIPETGDKTKALPPDMIEVFDSENDYNKLMDDLIMLKTTKQIAVRLLNDENLKWVNITNKALYNHLKKKGIIKIGYSAFCKSLNKNS